MVPFQPAGRFIVVLGKRFAVLFIAKHCHILVNLYTIMV